MLRSLTVQTKIRCKPVKGFTLIELMIVVAVVGVIAALAYPSYVDSVRKGKRSDAQSALMEVAQKEETYYARNATYTADMRLLGYAHQNWNNVKGGSSKVYYQARVSAADANHYILLAKPKAGTDQVNDTVVRFRLDSSGKRDYKTSDNTWHLGWNAH